ncbi:MAG: hypothetical protein PVH29_08795 [Candidatus Zixiibacteriota bacterium]|jgi:hypothetical protein
MRKLTLTLIAGTLALAGLALAETTFTSADGGMVITAQDDGSVVNPQGKTVMTLGADGTMTRGDGEVVGKLVGDTIYDKDGEVRAVIEADGTIVARRELGKIVGTEVYSPDGELVGTLSDTSPTATHLGLMALHRGGRGPGDDRRGAPADRKGGPPPGGRAPHGPPDNSAGE